MTLFLFLNNSGCNSPPDCCYARTILGLPRKIDNANTTASIERSGLFCACDSPPDCHGRRAPKALPVVAILGLPGKIGNANTMKSQAKAGLFSYFQTILAATVHRTVATPGAKGTSCGRNTWPTRDRSIMPTYSLDRKVGAVCGRAMPAPTIYNWIK